MVTDKDAEDTHENFNTQIADEFRDINSKLLKGNDENQLNVVM
jgi:hypothetical protein